MGLNVALWPTIAGVAILVIGLVAVKDRFFASRGLDRLIVLGPALAAGSIASFGAEHMAIGKEMVGMVPQYMPWHTFWVYFVGAALLATGLSLAVGRCVRWSAPSLAGMLFLFVAMLSLPSLVAHPENRLTWTLTLRDSCFGLGALALAVSLWGESRGAKAGSAAWRWMILGARVVIGAALVFYGVQYLLHPDEAGGIPLEKMTPGWVPGLRLWGYLGGLILIAGGAAVVINKRARFAAALVGLWMVVVTVFLYLPIFVLDPPELKLEGMNYVFDTLFFGGTMLLLAGALPREDRLSVWESLRGRGFDSRAASKTGLG